MQIKTCCTISAVLLLAVAVAEAQVRRSSRNLKPLRERQEQAGSLSGNSGLSTTPATPRQPATTTKTQVLYMGPKQGWGIMKKTAPYYTPQGKNLGTLPGGTVFRYNDVRSSERNSMLVSMIRRNTSWEGPFLLDCAMVAGYEGDPDSLDPQVVANLRQYFTISDSIELRRKELLEQTRSNVPELAAARKAHAAWQESIKKAAELEQQAQGLTGFRKTRANEELRKLKYEQVRLKAESDSKTAAYTAWKQANPLHEAALERDPKLLQLKQQLAECHVKVANLVPAE